MRILRKRILYPKTKRSLRIFIASFFYYSGVTNFLIKAKLKKKACILMYHRVLDKVEMSGSCSQDGIIVSKKTFEAHMQYLQKHLNVISLTDMIQKIKSKITFAPNSCLVTFDDGWKDNFQIAYPILEKYKVPAAIFLPTDFIGTNMLFWQERLTKLLTDLYRLCLQNANSKKKVIHTLNTEGIPEILSTSSIELNEKISKFVSIQKNRKKLEVKSLIEKIESSFEATALYDGIEDSVFLDWNEIKYMAGNGIEFGSHGKTHTILTETDLDLQQEFLASKSTIESQIDAPVRSFSYPNGDYTKEIAEQARQYGYEIAFGTESGFVSHTDDPYTLKRINIHEDMTRSTPMFLARIAGFW